MDFIKNRLFSRQSGVRHLVALLLTPLVLALTYGVMIPLTGEEYWLEDLYHELSRYQDVAVFYGVLGMLVGAGALMGGWLRRCGEKWIVRFLQKFFYSVIGLIPIVNLLVPLIYQRRRRKQGRMEFVSDGSFRSSLEGETYRALVTDNVVLHPDGKLKYSIIRYVFASTFRFIGGCFLLVFALLIPALTPAGVVLGIGVIALVSEYSAEAAFWVGAAAAGLTVIIDVLQPMIALLIHPRKRKAAPEAYRPDPEPAWDPPKADTEEPVAAVDPVPEPAPEPEPEPEPEDVPDEEMALALAGACPEDYPNDENGHGREIENHKEKEL